MAKPETLEEILAETDAYMAQRDRRHAIEGGKPVGPHHVLNVEQYPWVIVTLACTTAPAIA